MNVIENVIQGLECLGDPGYECDADRFCNSCPYDPCTCGLDVLNDALRMLKSQEPRLMAYDELEDTMADRAVWYEGFLVGVPSLCMVLAKSSTEDAYRIVDFVNEKIRLVPRKTYGGVWRCWTARPTDAQREATPWS